MFYRYKLISTTDKLLVNTGKYIVTVIVLYIMTPSTVGMAKSPPIRKKNIKNDTLTVTNASVTITVVFEKALSPDCPVSFSPTSYQSATKAIYLPPSASITEAHHATATSSSSSSSPSSPPPASSLSSSPSSLLSTPLSPSWTPSSPSSLSTSPPNSSST